MWQIWSFWSCSYENTRLLWCDCRLIEFNDVSEETAGFKIHDRPHRSIPQFPQHDVKWFVMWTAYDMNQEKWVK